MIAVLPYYGRRSLAVGTSAQSSGLALLITFANFFASALTVVAFGLLNIFINVGVSVFWNRKGAEAQPWQAITDV